MLLRMGFAALAISTGPALAGCSVHDTATGPIGSRQPSSSAVRSPQPSARTTAKPQEDGHAKATRWTCVYAPTMNRNWHDDVLCTKGSDSVRPNLLPKDRFVTEAAIMRAARAYEKKLNARS
ncbi:MAG TPA: hypothetical protein VGK17_10170 [Propionicimonas sp.]